MCANRGHLLLLDHVLRPPCLFQTTRSHLAAIRRRDPAGSDAARHPDGEAGVADELHAAGEHRARPVHGPRLQHAFQRPPSGEVCLCVLSRGRKGSTGSTVQELVESLGEVTTLGLSKGRSLVGPTKGQALTLPPAAGAILTPGRVAAVAFLAAGMVAGMAACAL